MGDVETRVFKYVELGSWDKVTREIEEHDSMHFDKPASAAAYAAGLLAYLICGDLNSARFLFKRLGKETQDNSDVAAAWSVGRALWVDDACMAHKALEKYSWAASFKNLVASLQAELRERTVKLLRSAYTNIPVERVQGLLNLSKEEVLVLGKSLNWEYDAGIDSLCGDKPDTARVVQGSQGISGVDTVVRNALFLEQLAQ